MQGFHQGTFGERENGKNVGKSWRALACHVNWTPVKRRGKGDCVEASDTPCCLRRVCQGLREALDQSQRSEESHISQDPGCLSILAGSFLGRQPDLQILNSRKDTNLSLKTYFYLSLSPYQCLLQYLKNGEPCNRGWGRSESTTPYFIGHPERM